MESSPKPLRLAPIDHVLDDYHISKLLFIPQNSTSTAEVVSILRQGLIRLIERFPMLGGCLQLDKDNDAQKGTLQLAGPWRRGHELFYESDLRDKDELDYSKLREQGFPVTHLDRNILVPDFAPETTLNRPVTLARPVIFVQVTLVRGGLILNFGVNHMFSDGNGGSAVGQAYAACCRGEADGGQTLGDEDFDRTPLLHGSGFEDIKNHADFVYEPSPTFGVRVKKIWQKVTQSFYRNVRRTAINFFNLLRFGRSGPKVIPKTPTFTLVEEFFFIPSKNLVELKNLATRARNNSSPSEWISTNDALFSLITCCMLSVNLSEHADKSHIKSPSNDEGFKHKESVQRAGPSNDQVDRRSASLDPLLQSKSLPISEYAILDLPMNIRRYFNPPLRSGCLGNVLRLVRTAAPLETLVPATDKNVADFALLIRREMQKTDEALIRRKIDALGSVPDISRAHFTVRERAPVKRDLLWTISSWQSQQWSNLNFGEKVGRVERVRVCHGEYYGYCIVMPEIREGSLAAETLGTGVEFFISLLKEKNERLKQNELFKRFVEWPRR